LYSSFGILLRFNFFLSSLYRWLRADTAGGTYSAISGATSVNYTVTSDDLNKYLKFEVTPVSNTAPTIGSAVLSSASSQVNEVDYINQILSTGQSLSVGVAASPALTTSQPYSNLMLTGGAGGLGAGGSFTPLLESSVETISSSMANTITANDIGTDFDVAVSLHGVSGYTYSQLKKGTGPYATGMNQVTNAKSAATTLGRTSRVIGVTTIHGETDNYNGVSGATYQSYLEEWQSDYETDIKAITGQSGTIPLFLCQMSSFMSSYANDATSEIPIYQLKAAEDNPGKIVLVAPKYFFNYSDRHHLTAASSRWLGEYYGKVMKKVVIDHESWRPLTPDTVERSGAIIYATFHVPSGSLAFDTTLVSARTNYGFEYYDSTSSATISSVQLLDSDTVKVTLSGVPTGSNQRLRYAYTGVPGTDTGGQNAGTAAGNLRDTDSFPSLYGNTLYNWAVHFDQPITLDATSPTITSVSSDKANGTYAAGDVIDIDVTFSEAVTSTGSVTVTLETGVTDRTCTFSVSNSTTGTCNYTVQAGDTSGDLTVSSISGTIADQQTNGLVNFSPTTNLAANKAIVIDTSGPTFSLVTSNPDTTSAVISWTTNEAASSLLDYGLTSSYGVTTSETNTSPRVTEHTVTLSGLLSCITYHYRVQSTDASSNTVTDTDRTFTTTGCTGSAEVVAQTAAPITTASGGSLDLLSSGNGITLAILLAFFGSDVIFQIKKMDVVVIIDVIVVLSGFSTIGGYIYDLKALSGVATSITNFNNDITLTLSYGSSDVSGMNESSLKIYYWDGAAWIALSCSAPNTSARTVTCTTSHFSTFGLFGQVASSSSGGGSSSSRGGGGGLPTGALNAPTIPAGGFDLMVNKGNLTTSERIIPITFTAGADTKKTAISLTGDFTDASQEIYQPTIQFDLCSKYGGRLVDPACPAGTYTVYVKFYTQYGQPSEVISRTIQLVAAGSVKAPVVKPTPVPASKPNTSQALHFTKDLKLGTIDAEVKLLQQFLNTHGFVIAKRGVGSPGKETNIFGPLTKAAVIRFQEAYAKEILTPSGFKRGTGMVAAATRAKLNQLVGN
jgi:hypothetical protein